MASSVYEFIAEEKDDGLRIDKFLAAATDDELSRSRIQKLISDSLVSSNSAPVKANYRLRAGDVVSIEIPEASPIEAVPENIPLDIIYEDDDLLIVNKPKGMVVHPAPGHESGTLVNAVLFHCKGSLSGINGALRPGIVHRIDRDTTGSLIICKNDPAHRAIAAQLAAHSMNRVYVGITQGRLKDDSGVIHTTIGRDKNDRKKMACNVPGGRDAITHFSVIKRFPDTTYAEFKLETGRTHQIRVHMKSIGHPLLGDEVYGKPNTKYKLNGQCLHARTIGFIHPTTGEYMEFEAPIPEYMEKLLRAL